MPSRTTKDIGDMAENVACQYLEKQGLTLSERNFRCRHGEIDLIMHDRQSLIFIEVRFRRHHQFGCGAESVDYRKQQKLLASANYYLQQQSTSVHHSKKYIETANQACRFDVISMTSNNFGEIDSSHINWIQNAFGA